MSQKTIGSAIAGLTVTLMVGACAGATPGPTEVPVTPVTPVRSPTPLTPTATVLPVTPTGIATEVPIQARAESAGVVCTVQRARVEQNIGGQQAPGSQVWLVLTLVIENTGAEPQHVANVGFSARDSEGNTYSERYPGPYPTLGGGELVQGERVRGDIVLLVAEHGTFTVFWPSPSGDVRLGTVAL